MNLNRFRIFCTILQSRSQNVAENQSQTSDNTVDTNNTSNAAENSEPMQVSDDTATAEASGPSGDERREMVIHL